MNKKGFTLIELMVTIVIIGLISFIGFPSLMRIVSDNDKKEFEYYGESMIAAAKLYIQKEGKDIRKDSSSLNKLKNDQYIIDMNTLVTLDYIESYKPSKKALSCESGGVRVKLEESTNTYTYTYQLVCKNTSSKKKYTKSYDKEEFTVSTLN